MKEFFQELLGYTHHYNQQLADIFKANPDKVSEKSIKLFSHILNAQHIWNCRINGIKPSIAVWDIHAIKDFQFMDKINYENSLQILEAFDLNKDIHFTTSSGLSLNNSVRNLLFQVINHTTYHRGQIATEFKNSGIAPLSSDFIFYKH